MDIKVEVIEKRNNEIENQYTMEIPKRREKDFILSLMEYGYSHNNMGNIDYMCKVNDGLEKIVKIYK